MTYNKDSGRRNVYIDAEEVLADVMADEDAKDIPEGFTNKITFLAKGYDSSWTGLDKMSDINMWNLTLQSDEVQTWTRFGKGALDCYKLVDWNSATWSTGGFSQQFSKTFLKVQ